MQLSIFALLGLASSVSAAPVTHIYGSNTAEAAKPDDSISPDSMADSLKQQLDELEELKQQVPVQQEAGAVKAAQAATPKVTLSKHITPLPAKPSVQLPIPHGPGGFPGSHHWVEDDRALKLNASDVLADPKLAAIARMLKEKSKKPKVIYAQAEQHVAEHHVPVPPKPDVKLPIPHGHPEAGAAPATKVAAAAEEKVPLSKHHVPVPAKPTVKLPVPHGHPEAGLVQAAPVAVPKVTLSKHHVPVPPKTAVKLPIPHGHPEAGAAQAAKLVVAAPEKTQVQAAAPMSCNKLDACLAEAGAEVHDKDKSESKFKACFESFCAELYGDKDLKKSDARTALCDAKGKDALEILSKANVQAQSKLSADQKAKTHTALLQLLMAEPSVTVTQMAAKCRA